MATATCSIEEAEGVRSGPGCADRDNFADFVRRLFGYSSVKNFVGTLSTLARFNSKEPTGTVSLLVPAHCSSHSFAWLAMRLD